MKRKRQTKSVLPIGIPFAACIGVCIFFTFQLFDYVVNKPSVPGLVRSPVLVIDSKPITKMPPTRITIPAIQKSLPVQASVVNGNKWELFPTSVAWLSTSAIPGEGNVILYAHNWQSLWGDLYKLQVGDTIEVQQNNITKLYQVTESRAVKPTDIEAILSDEDQLTLYTCEGTFDQKRRVVYAKPVTSQ